MCTYFKVLFTYPDRLVDSCKYLNTNQMVKSQIFFLLSPTFKHTLYNIFKQAVGPGVLQTFSTCTVKH